MQTGTEQGYQPKHTHSLGLVRYLLLSIPAYQHRANFFGNMYFPCGVPTRLPLPLMAMAWSDPASFSFSHYWPLNDPALWLSFSHSLTPTTGHGVTQPPSSLSVTSTTGHRVTQPDHIAGTTEVFSSHKDKILVLSGPEISALEELMKLRLQTLATAKRKSETPFMNIQDHFSLTRVRQKKVRGCILASYGFHC